VGSPGDQLTRRACCGQGHALNRAGRPQGPPCGGYVALGALSEDVILSMPQSLQVGGNRAIRFEAGSFRTRISPTRYLRIS
jgi:hypothetical protein